MNYRTILRSFVCASLLAGGWPAAAQTAPTSIPMPPAFAPDAAPLHLDDIGLYGVGVVLRGSSPGTNPFPDGWSGTFDDRYGLACQPAEPQNGKPAFLLHPPWRGGTPGFSYQTFRIQLPKTATKITLNGATALRADAVGKSDGVTFRVFVDGQKRLDVNRKDGDWQPFSLDLSADAGKTVLIRFESDPGPQDNASFDFGLWGDRTITFTGWTPPVTTQGHTAPPPLDLRHMASVQDGSVAPRNGFAGTTTCHIVNGQAVLRYQGPDGALEYHWQPPAAESDPVLGNLLLQATPHGASVPVTVPLGGQSRLNWADKDATIHRTNARLTAAATPGAATLRETYTVGGQTATVTITGHLAEKSLVLDIACDQPRVANLMGGEWGPVLRRRRVAIPYYSGNVLYLAHEDLFANAFLDWTASQASRLDGTQAIYDARTDGTRVPLKERLIYTAAWHLDEALPNIPNPPSPFRKDLSYRVVLDIWGGTFDSVRQRLAALADQGIAPGIAIVHVWQRSGYDNALPDHVPANAGLGGDPAMQALVQYGEKAGFRMALHENYVDYYPNSDHFTDTDIARKSDGSRVNAWYNKGTKMQSFAVKPTRILPLAQQQSPEVLKRYGSSACYLDVHSAVSPWFHVDFDSTQSGAGTFRPTWDAHRALWDYERNLHKGPVFGEGNAHWYWSGYLDGVEAQFGQGWRDGKGTSAPLLVDFDLLKIHPLQFNHGMGYYERWWEKGPGQEDSRSLLDLLDQYRMQEAAYGHAAFLAASTWSNIPLAWLETHLLTPVTSRYATAHPLEIAYEHNGKWQDATATVKENGDFSRVRIRYDNGLSVWANSSDSPLTIGGATLPRWGWLATGAGLRPTGTTLRSDIVSDYAETPDSLFANARVGDDWLSHGATRIAPTVASFTPTGPRTFRATYSWAVGQAIRDDERCFVHFVQPNSSAPEGIAFQGDHPLPVPTTQWKPGSTVTDGPHDITVPATVATGDYPWTIGLYGATGRLNLQGRSDGHGRTLLGTVHVTADRVSFTPVAPPASGPKEPVNAAGRLLDFGPLRTDGSVWLHRDGPDWVLQPFPRDRAFTLELSATRFPPPATVRAINSDGTTQPLKPIRNGDRWKLPLNGAKTYRWPATP